MNVLLLNGSPRGGGEYRHCFKRDGEGLSRGGHRDRGSPGGEQGHPGLRGLFGLQEKTGSASLTTWSTRPPPNSPPPTGLVIGTPVYYASANGTLISFLDRLFYSTPFDKTMKVGAAVAVARRGGVSATLRRAEQVLRHLWNAHRHGPVLERGVRRSKRRGQGGRRGNADHAHSGPETWPF